MLRTRFIPVDELELELGGAVQAVYTLSLPPSRYLGIYLNFVSSDEYQQILDAVKNDKIGDPTFGDWNGRLKINREMFDISENSEMLMVTLPSIIRLFFDVPPENVKGVYVIYKD